MKTERELQVEYETLLWAVNDAYEDSLGDDEIEALEKLLKISAEKLGYDDARVKADLNK